jgi:LEA14-like dessication related protein
MNMKTIAAAARIPVLFFSFCIFFTSCSVFETPEIREPDEMTVQILSFEDAKANIRIESHCHNQNGIGFTLKGGELDLMLDSFKLGTAIIDTSFKVAAHSDFMVPIQLKIDAAEMGKTNMDFSKGVKVTVDGKMKGSAFGINRTLPIHYEKMHTINLVLPYKL